MARERAIFETTVESRKSERTNRQEKPPPIVIGACLRCPAPMAPRWIEVQAPNWPLTLEDGRVKRLYLKACN